MNKSYTLIRNILFCIMVISLGVVGGGLLASCSEQDILPVESTDAVEIGGVEAEIAGGATTRAAALDANNYVGRSAFINNDQMVLTTLKRTEQPIPGFSYTGIVYVQEIEAGQTSGGWNRNKNEGRTEASEAHPERIYWSDAANAHTYIGYSLPQQATGVTFDWNLKNAYYDGAGTTSIPVYYGSLGDPTQLQTESEGVVTNYIDYTNDANDSPVNDVDDKGNATGTQSYKSGNEKLKHDDLLLTFATDKVAETGGSVAKLYFHHALAMVRVIVNIQGFSASTDAADSKSEVSNMVLEDMLTLYKWRQQSYCAEALDATYDNANVEAMYGSGVTCDQKKDIHLWIPRPAGTGTGVGKQFTFYGLAVPHTMGVDNATGDKAENLHLQFKVHYQDPMNPWTDPETKQNPNMKDHTYTAVMPNSVKFSAGYCTTINVTLNHSNEQMTVGAEYMDWQYVETPDQGELKKNSAFLSYIPTDDDDRIAKKIYIADDEQATEDDATWLYKDANDKIVDIYGNDGTLTSPYIISTANQLLSFAYEVKSSRTFKGQYVKLDADIVMQKSVSDTDISWIGIGDATHAFYGTFDGGSRNISFLKGAPLFYKLEQFSVVDKLNLSDIIEIDGFGAIANENHEGLICCCYIDGDIKGNATSGYWGSIVGTNHKGLVVGCSHVGTVTGNASATAISGLVGYNNLGSVIASYHSGPVNGGTGNVFAAIGAYTADSYAIGCYFNKDLNEQDYPDLNKLIGHVAFPLSTDEMQREKFVNSTDYIYNDGHIHTNWWEQHYSLNKALEMFVEQLAAVDVTSGYATFLTLTLTSEGKQKFLSHFAASSNGGTTWTLRDDHKFVYRPGEFPVIK